MKTQRATSSTAGAHLQHRGDETREWIVVGGTGRGGIIVRKGADLASPQLVQRLRTGAVILEVDLIRDRLHYKLADGQPDEIGPLEGWVSMRMGNTQLLQQTVPCIREQQTAAWEERRVWLEEFLHVCAGKPYQLELHEAWASASGLKEKANVRSELHLNAQQILCAKFARGVPMDIFRSGASLNKKNVHEAMLISWIAWFCNPAAQAVHTQGPSNEDPALSAREMSQLLVDRNPYRLPSAKVLVMAPLKVCRANIRVFGALSGDLLCTFSAELDDQVRHLKTHISRLEGTPTHQQQLVAGAQRLVDMQEVRRLIGAEHDRQGESASVELVLLRHHPEKADKLRQLEHGNLNLWDLPSALEDESDFALAALKRSPLAMKFAPSTLRNNRDFMMLAVQLRGEVLEYASEDLLRDRALVLMAVGNNGNALRFVGPSLLNDPEVVLTAVEQEGMALQHASADLQANRCIVLTAVEHKGQALTFASSTLQADPDVVLAALRQTGAAARHVSQELRSNVSFLQKLDESGLDPDGSLLDRLLWVSAETAHEWLQANLAVFVDARDDTSFRISRIEGAYSLSAHSLDRQESYQWREREIDSGLKDIPAFRSLLESPRLPIVVYSDHGTDASRCGLTAHALRQHADVQSHRVWRMEQGLNGWKSFGFPLEGENRHMYEFERGKPLNYSEFNSKAIQNLFPLAEVF